MLILLLPPQPKLVKHSYNKLVVDSALKGNNNCHFVFVADSGSSMYMFHAIESLGISKNDAAQYANGVNEFNETGTLGPKFPVSIIPLSVYNERNNMGDGENMKKIISDVFKANEEIIKLSEIFFCIEKRPDFEYGLALETITNYIQENILYFTKEVKVLD